ncbi:MAG TPA: RluA family pseudouridine synthase [Ktedonobacteraceae bacterium]|nr:RluA family pseudouridine synthase [Ktedonobacteraceae bacterium]
MTQEYDLNRLSMAEDQQWTIQPEQVGVRLDRYLTSLLKDLSRTSVQQLITEEAVLINDKPAKAGYALRLHDTIHVLRAVPSPPQNNVIQQELPLDIVYEDADLLVVNKAAGMVVHPAPGHHDDTLVNALLARYAELRVTEDDQRPGIVHRLDRDTSGLLIVAKNTHTQAALVEQMKCHEVVKRYLALVEGIVALDSGTIDAPIGRNPRHRQQMAITAFGSREARTHFRVLERFSHYTLLLLQLETGRTHQIRVHLKAIGHPVVGDPVYGSGRKHPGLLSQRQFLHAYQLQFTHPITGEAVELEAPLPTDLQAGLDSLQNGQ